MRTTKDEREYLRAKYSRAKDYDDDVRRDVLYLLDDADAAEYLAGQLQRAGLDAADAQAALTTIALAAGLGADASVGEVAARVGELRGALVEMHLASLDIEGLSPTESSTRWSRMIDADDAIDNLARRLAEEAGRDEDAAPAIVQPVGGCDGSREFAYDGSAEDGRGLRLARRCPGCRACS